MKSIQWKPSCQFHVFARLSIWSWVWFEMVAICEMVSVKWVGFGRQLGLAKPRVAHTTTGARMPLRLASKWSELIRRAILNDGQLVRRLDALLWPTVGVGRAQTSKQPAARLRNNSRPQFEGDAQPFESRLVLALERADSCDTTHNLELPSSNSELRTSNFERKIMRLRASARWRDKNSRECEYERLTRRFELRWLALDGGPKASR